MCCSPSRASGTVGSPPLYPPRLSHGAPPIRSYVLPLIAQGVTAARRGAAAPGAPPPTTSCSGAPWSSRPSPPTPYSRYRRAVDRVDEGAAAAGILGRAGQLGQRRGQLATVALPPGQRDRERREPVVRDRLDLDAEHAARGTAARRGRRAARPVRRARSAAAGSGVCNATSTASNSWLIASSFAAVPMRASGPPSAGVRGAATGAGTSGVPFASSASRRWNIHVSVAGAKPSLAREAGLHRRQQLRARRPGWRRDRRSPSSPSSRTPPRPRTRRRSPSARGAGRAARAPRRRSQLAGASPPSSFSPRGTPARPSAVCATRIGLTRSKSPAAAASRGTGTYRLAAFAAVRSSVSAPSTCVSQARISPTRRPCASAGQRARSQSSAAGDGSCPAGRRLALKSLKAASPTRRHPRPDTEADEQRARSTPIGQTSRPERAHQRHRGVRAAGVQARAAHPVDRFGVVDPAVRRASA